MDQRKSEINNWSSALQTDHVKNEVYTKVISEEMVNKTVNSLENGPASYIDENGQTSEILVFEECGLVMVRIYDISLEIENKGIKEYSSNYGIIKT